MVQVIYDSNYGNTKQVAEAIAAEFPDARCVSVDDAGSIDLKCNLLIVGSPINGWRPTPKLAAFLAQLRPGQLAGVKAAAFDTRINTIFSGNAAKKIAKSLQKAGATLVAPPEAFCVAAKEGPLAAGEIEKAKRWAKSTLPFA